MIEIVYIELNGNDESENPQIIFESINSTGLSLTASDLIRNFLLMGIDYEAQNRLYKDYWTCIEERIPTNQISTFIRFYLTLNNGVTVNERRVYEEYKHFFINNKYTSEIAIMELENYSKYYYWIISESVPNKKVNDKIKHINLMKATVVYPYFMEILKLADDEQYSWEEINEILEVIESYLFRRLITDKKTNVLNKLFASLSREVACTEEKARIINELVNKRGTQLFPRDSEFAASLKTIDLYHRRNNLAKLTLMMLESNKSKEIIEFDSMQVEHIMPQTLTNEWKIAVKNAVDVQMKYGDTIGNLTLTGYNAELSNKLFREKANLYKGSNISITRELSEKYEIWNAATIELRAIELSEKAQKIWKFPVQNISEGFSSLSGEHFLDEDISVKGSKPRFLTIDGKDYRVESWRKLLLVFLDFVWDIDSQTFSNLKKKEALKKLFANKDEIRNPRKLTNGEIIETNYSADSILSIIKIISLEYNIFDDISFTLL